MSTPTTAPTIRTITVTNDIPLTIAEYGADAAGPTIVLLHSGAGPRTLLGLSAALAPQAHVIAPTHPGFDGTPRPDRLASVADLAEAYLDLLDTLDLSEVVLVGNSVGGWIASEMALRDNHARIAAVVLMNAVGIKSDRPENQIVDTRASNPADISKLSFANAAFRPDFGALSDAERAVMAANQQALAQYGGPGFTSDAGLRDRLHRVTVPALAIWGEQDGIAPLGYGREFAESFPNSRFAPIPDAGHFPQIEQLPATLGVLTDFAATVVKTA